MTETRTSKLIQLIVALLLAAAWADHNGYARGYVAGNDDGYMERRAEEAIDYKPVNRYTMKKEK